MKKVTVTASLTYDVIIDNGILDHAGEESSKVIKPCKAAILTDSNVAPLYAERLENSLKNAGYSPLRFTIKAGEESKSAESYLSFLNFLAKNQLTRTDCIFALGGGVVGDLAGFAAATYLRGIRFIQIPTTLLAMVDSSVGGKTAIDIPAGKNLVGAFYQPSLVLCDPKTLDTLSKEIFADGCAEVIKYGIINDKQLFEKLKSPIKPQIENVIEACVTEKRDVVNADERDVGVRQLLNLGHTAAHSIETISHFEISHGSAVAIGTAIISRAAAKLGYCPESDTNQIIATLELYGLPTECPYTAGELAEVALRDKKRNGDTINLIVPFGIGNSQIHKIPVTDLEGFLAAGL
ncbi:MAG: 3-dehydroquinate synthase [Clostridia bacterium]|nr:3-dehydroquinate synthase [Clostridia bacterium]